MRTFLAKNGMLNHVLIGTGLLDPLAAQSLLDWRGIVVVFVWKQAPFVTLLVAGAMASLDRQHIEAARNLGASRWRVLWDIVLPQVRGTVLVGMVLSFVTMLSVLSVPLMINPNSPTMITVDVTAYRIYTHSDYAVANALCLLVTDRRRRRCGFLSAARGEERGGVERERRGRRSRAIANRRRRPTRPRIIAKTEVGPRSEKLLSVFMVRTRTLVSGNLDLMIRVASIPSRTGILISIRTTSGLCSSTAWMAARPCSASATTCRLAVF